MIRVLLVIYVLNLYDGGRKQIQMLCRPNLPENNY